MSEPNPFAFNDANTSQLPSSNASSQSELTKLRRENATLQREKATLQRETETLKDANGVARIMNDAKKEVQAHEREMKRAQMAERIARDALDTLRNTADNTSTVNTTTNTTINPIMLDDDEDQKFKRNDGVEGVTSNNTAITSDKNDECKDKTIEQLEDKNMTLELDNEVLRALVTAAEDKVKNDGNHDSCERALHNVRTESEAKVRGLFDLLNIAKTENEQLRNEAETAMATLQSELQTQQGQICDLNEKYEQRVHEELEDANVKIADQQDQLAASKTELAEVTKNFKYAVLSVEEFGKRVEKVEAYNKKLAADLQDKDNLNKHLTEINDGLRADLADGSAQYQTLRHERNELEEHLVTTQLALRHRESSEAKALDDLAACQAELERVTGQNSEHYEGLQTDFENLRQEVEQSRQTILVKEERIAHLEHEARQIVLGKDQRIAELEHEATDKSLQQELEEGGISDLDDEQLSEAPSDPREPAQELLLSPVADIVSMDPHDPTVVSSTVPAGKNVAPGLAVVIAYLAWNLWVVGYKLRAWEQANGDGLGEGYSLM